MRIKKWAAEEMNREKNEQESFEEEVGRDGGFSDAISEVFLCFFSCCELASFIAVARLEHIFGKLNLKILECD